MAEYYLSRRSKHGFRVAKFDDTVAPVRVYWVEYHFGVNPKKDRCNCWNKINCLHIRMVEEFYRLGCPIGYGVYYWPPDYGNDLDEAMESFRLPYSKGFYFNSKGELCR